MIDTSKVKVKAGVNTNNSACDIALVTSSALTLMSESESATENDSESRNASIWNDTGSLLSHLSTQSVFV